MIDYKKKYLKYKKKYNNEMKKIKKIKGGASMGLGRGSSGTDIDALVNDIKIEESGGNIFAIAAAKTFHYISTISDPERQQFYTNVKSFLQNTLLPSIIEGITLNSVNKQSIELLTRQIQTIVSNIDNEFPNLVRNIANKISDLDTKIVLKRDTGVPIVDNLVAFGLTRIKYAEGELLDLSIPIQNTKLGNIVSSANCKEDRIMRELGIIIFNQPTDTKTPKRINRYIFQSIYFEVGINETPQHIPWYDISTRLMRNGSFNSIRVKNRTQYDFVDSLLIDPSNATQQQDKLDNNEFSTIYDNTNGSPEYKEDTPDAPLGELPLLCNHQLVLNKINSIRETLSLLFTRRQSNFSSINFNQVLRAGSSAGIFVQIFNPDIHNEMYFTSRGLTSNDAHYVVIALRSKKVEIAYKTELHACILATINRRQGDLPYMTLDRNIKIIIGDMNEILDEEIRHLYRITRSIRTIEHYFSDISRLHEINAVCATVLEKITYSNLFNMWNNRIVQYYAQNEIDLQAEVTLTKPTRFGSYGCTYTTERIQWDIEPLLNDWERNNWAVNNDTLQDKYNFGSATAWHNGHAFTSNHIHSVNDPGRLILLTDIERYQLVSTLQFDLTELAQAYVNLNPVQKMFYLKLIGFQNMDVLYNFISNMPSEYINEIYNYTPLMTLFDSIVRERTGIESFFTQQLSILLTERQRQASTPTVTYNHSAQATPSYSQPSDIFQSYERPSSYSSQNGTLIDSLVHYTENPTQYNSSGLFYSTPTAPAPQSPQYSISGLFGSTPTASATQSPQYSISGLFGSTPSPQGQGLFSSAPASPPPQYSISGLFGPPPPARTDLSSSAPAAPSPQYSISGLFAPPAKPPPHHSMSGLFGSPPPAGTGLFGSDYITKSSR